MVHVLLGYLDEKNKKNELKEKNKINKKFISKIGGKPFWLDRINLPNEKSFHCTLCSKLMSFLLQIYAPLDNISKCFHRCLYLFVCLNCGDQVKCFRTQLPRSNLFYNYYLENINHTDNESNSSNELNESIEVCKLDESDESNSSNESIESIEVCKLDESNKSNKSNKCNENKEISSDYINLYENSNNTFNKKLEYYFCCNICGIPSINTKKHKFCELKNHVIFKEKKIYISDEDDCESSSTGNESFSEEYEETYINENYKDLYKENNNENEKNKNINENDKDDSLINDNKKYMNDDDIKNIENKDDNDLDISEMKAFEDIQKDMENQRKIDHVFKNYIKKIQRFPKQIIRYSYNGTPLYSSCDNYNYNQNNFCEEVGKIKHFNTNKNKIPNCHVCGGRMIFEFQVLSTIINYLKIKKNISFNKNITLNSKFSIIAIYTCENNCDMYDINDINLKKKKSKINRYVQEYAYVQIEN